MEAAVYFTSYPHLDGLFSPSGYRPGSAVAFKGLSAVGKTTTLFQFLLAFERRSLPVRLLSSEGDLDRLRSMGWPLHGHTQQTEIRGFNSIEELTSKVSQWLDSPSPILLIDGFGRVACRTHRLTDVERKHTEERKRIRNINASLLGQIRKKLPGSEKLLIVTDDDMDYSPTRARYLPIDVSFQFFDCFDAIFTIEANGIPTSHSFDIKIVPARLRAKGLRVNETSARIAIRDGAVLESKITGRCYRYTRNREA